MGILGFYIDTCISPTPRVEVTVPHRTLRPAEGSGKCNTSTAVSPPY